MARLRFEDETKVEQELSTLWAMLKAAEADNKRLRAFAESIGRCSCKPGLCDTKMDFQCRAREALDGIANQ
jgi:hypothetical protein